MLFYRKMQRLKTIYVLTVLCCVVSVEETSMSSEVQLQTQAPTTGGTNSPNSNTSDVPPICEQHDLHNIYVTPYGRKLSKEAYCNVSALNEQTGFDLQHLTFSVRFYCHGAFPSSLWNGMFGDYWSSKLLLSVEIQNCLLTSISSNAFKGLSKLRKLIIQGGYDTPGDFCNQTEKADFLEETEAVEKICSRNLWFPSGIFSGLKKLDHLTFNAVKLNNSVWEQIGELRNLQNLSMQDNSISILEKDTLNKLTRLKTLDLTNNGIKTVLSKTFKSQAHFNWLNLSLNTINTIADDAFDGLVILQILNLSGNQITTVYSRLFESLGNLKGLDLSDNNINIIEDGAFYGMRNILLLDLNRNKINRILNDTFAHLSSLKKLYLSNNHIYYAASDTFLSGGNLKLLDISYNNISTFEYENHTSPLSSTLETLIMHNNDMTTTGWLSYSVFPSLRIVDISQNKLHGRMINIAWPKRLEQVNVSRNDIEDLEIIVSDAFGVQTSLKQLDASHNQITGISIVDVLKSAPGGHGLISFYIGNNPFHCDCNMVWLQKLITLQSSSTNTFVIRDSEALYCQTLFRHEKGFMKNIKPDNFLCEYNMSCPEMCTCYQNEISGNVNIIDCKGNNIIAISNEISKDCTVLDLSGNLIDSLKPGDFDRLSHLGELFVNSSQISKIKTGTFRNLSDLIKLDLANNQLKTLETETFEGLVRLEDLDLQFNRINHIGKGSFQPLKALKYLDIRNNQLKTISMSEFKFLSQIQSVNLSQNPWSCECGYVEMMKRFMNQNTRRIHDSDDIACEYYNEEMNKNVKHFLLEVYKPKFCVNDAVTNVYTTLDTDLIISVSVVLAVVAIGLLTFILAFKHRKFLQLWCFIKFGWKFHGGNENDDEDRPYDAFVSYSSKDGDIVAREIAPHLEEPRNGREGYKLCLHDRDFPAGASIAETIIYAVRNSKRVIVILSDNYLRSQWCQYEFQKAHYQLVMERRNRIVMILLREISPNLVYKEIGLYLRTRTYLKYDDPWSWSKIEYAMPKTKALICAANQNRDNNSDRAEFIPLDFMA